MEKRFYSWKDVMELTGLSRSGVYVWMNREDFPKIRVGRRILVPVDAFERWIETQTLNGKGC